MINRRIIAILTLLLLPAILQAQTKDEVRQEFTKYMGLLEAKDFASTMDYLPNALFEQMPKEDLLQAMEASLNNPMLEISFKNSKLHGVEDIFTVEGSSYAILEYYTEMDMAYLTSPAEDELAYVEGALKTQFGEDVVSLNKENSTFTIRSQKKACALYEDDRWKFVEYDAQQPEMAELILPQEVIAKLKDG